MAFRIQRVPRGLNELLSVFGGQTPVELEERTRGTVELLQLYGLSQVQRQQALNAALAEGGVVTIDVPSNQCWVLYNVEVSVAKTATQTALALSLALGPLSNGITTVASWPTLSPFGATETGTLALGWSAPYPRVLLGGWRLQTRLDILGTDATASVILSALVGVLG